MHPGKCLWDNLVLQFWEKIVHEKLVALAKGPFFRRSLTQWIFIVSLGTGDPNKENGNHGKNGNHNEMTTHHRLSRWILMVVNFKGVSPGCYYSVWRKPVGFFLIDQGKWFLAWVWIKPTLLHLCYQCSAFNHLARDGPWSDPSILLTLSK